MMTVKELREWLDLLDSESFVGVDEGGLTLVQVLPGEVPQLSGNYIELGGVPEELEA